MTKQLLRGAAFALAALLVSVGVGAVAGTANNGYDKQKVVYHINDLDSADGAFRNVKNHLNAVGDEHAEIVVVTHSKGALALVDGTRDSKGKGFEGTIQALANRGVKFQMCNNTIEGLGIDRDMINLNVEVVPSGVAQVAHLQQQGYIYLKP